MDTNGNGKPHPLYLLASLKTEREWSMDHKPVSRLTLTVVERHGDRLRNGSSDGPLANLECEARYYHAGSLRGIHWERPEYRNVYAIDLDRVRVMAKTLEGLHRKLDKANAVDGHAGTFGEFALRVARALGIVGIVQERSERGSSYDDHTYRFMDLAEGRSTLDWMLADADGRAREKETAGA